MCGNVCLFPYSTPSPVRPERVDRVSESCIFHIMNNALLSGDQDRLNLALNSAHMGTWEWDVHTDLIWWDEQMHTLFGLAAGAFTGRSEDFFVLLHEEDRERARGEIVRTMRDCAEFDGEFRTVRPSDGSVHFLRMRWKVHYDKTARYHGSSVSPGTSPNDASPSWHWRRSASCSPP
jgi:PAS domain S-box-containing protein